MAASFFVAVVEQVNKIVALTPVDCAESVISVSLCQSITAIALNNFIRQMVSFTLFTLSTLSLVVAVTMAQKPIVLTPFTQSATTADRKSIFHIRHIFIMMLASALSHAPIATSV